MLHRYLEFSIQPLSVSTQVHHQEKPFGCRLCDFKAPRRDKVRRHLYITHGKVGDEALPFINSRRVVATVAAAGAAAAGEGGGGGATGVDVSGAAAAAAAVLGGLPSLADAATGLAILGDGDLPV